MPTLTIEISPADAFALRDLANRNQTSQSQLAGLAIKQLLISCRDAAPMVPRIDPNKIPVVEPECSIVMPGGPLR